MANSTSISISESSVYRNIYSGLRNPSYQASNERAALGASVDSQKWTFLQKLLAIEEAHDKKRLVKEMENKATVCPKVPKSKGFVDPGAPENDSLSRWMHGQVLDDGPEDSQIPHSHDNNREHADQTRLPPLHNSTSKQNSERNMTSSQSNIPNLPAITERASYSDTDSGLLLQNVSYDGDSPALQASQERLSGPPSTLSDEQQTSNRPRRKRQLRLPPILLPRIYTVTPRPLQYREFLTPTKIRGPITDEEWEDLKDCRYIRHAVPRFALEVSSSNMSSLQF